MNLWICTGCSWTALKQKPAAETGNWLTQDGVHMKPLGDAIMAVGVLRGLGVTDAKISRRLNELFDVLFAAGVLPCVVAADRT